jgi:formylmethanofuran dehydrogenase subunit E
MRLVTKTEEREKMTNTVEMFCVSSDKITNVEVERVCNMIKSRSKTHKVRCNDCGEWKFLDEITVGQVGYVCGPCIMMALDYC